MWSNHIQKCECRGQLKSNLFPCVQPDLTHGIWFLNFRYSIMHTHALCYFEVLKTNDGLKIFEFLWKINWIVPMNHSHLFAWIWNSIVKSGSVLCGGVVCRMVERNSQFPIIFIACKRYFIDRVMRCVHHDFWCTHFTWLHVNPNGRCNRKMSK